MRSFAIKHYKLIVKNLENFENFSKTLKIYVFFLLQLFLEFTRKGLGKSLKCS